MEPPSSEEVRGLEELNDAVHPRGNVMKSQLVFLYGRFLWNHLLGRIKTPSQASLMRAVFAFLTSAPANPEHRFQRFSNIIPEATETDLVLVTCTITIGRPRCFVVPGYERSVFSILYLRAMFRRYSTGWIVSKIKQKFKYLKCDKHQNNGRSKHKIFHQRPYIKEKE